MRRHSIFMTIGATALVLALPPAAHATRLVSVGAEDVRGFDSIHAGTFWWGALNNLPAGALPVGIDRSPHTGVVTAVIRSADNTLTLYDLDVIGGALERPRPLDGVPPTTADFGVDVNPALSPTATAPEGFLRLTGTDATNRRVNIATGGVVDDAPLDNTSGSESVPAVAYTNNDTNPATTTTLFDVEFGSNGLFVQSPPNDGTLASVGPLEITQGDPELSAFDIASDGTALLTAHTDRQRLFAVDLATGAATERFGMRNEPVYGMTEVDDVVTFQEISRYVAAGEADGRVAVNIRRLFGGDEPSTVSWSGNGQSGTVSFKPRDATATIFVRLDDDEVPEPRQTFEVRIDGRPHGTTIGWPTVAEVTVYDNDPVPPPPVVLLPGRCTNERKGTVADDALAGTTAGDHLSGLRGADGLSGGDGEDCLLGGVGDDLLSGGAGDDVLIGGAGADHLRGQGGNDVLVGGRGNDTLRGGGGVNAFLAGRGADVISTRNGRRENVNCGPGRDRVIVDRRDRLRGCEAVRRR